MFVPNALHWLSENIQTNVTMKVFGHRTFKAFVIVSFLVGSHIAWKLSGYGRWIATSCRSLSPNKNKEVDSLSMLVHKTSIKLCGHHLKLRIALKTIFRFLLVSERAEMMRNLILGRNHNLITWQWLSGNHVIVKITCTQQARVRHGNFPSLRRCYTTQFFRATSVATAKFALLQLHGKRCYPLQCFLQHVSQLVPQGTRLRLMQCINTPTLNSHSSQNACRYRPF